jgi:O-antigen/teichoic acid export membrane protein
LFAKGDRDDAQRMMNGSLVTLSTGIIFAVLVSFLFGREIVLVLFTDEYLEVSLAFALLMLNFYLRAISNILGYSLVAAGYSSGPVKANLVASIVNIVGSLIMIKMFGYIGAVYSLLLMNITSQIIYEILLGRANLAPHLLAYLKPIFMLAAAIGIDWLFGGNSILLKMLLVCLYIAGSWLFIEEIKGFSHTAMKYVFRPRARSESA